MKRKVNVFIIYNMSTLEKSTIATQNTIQEIQNEYNRYYNNIIVTRANSDEINEYKSVLQNSNSKGAQYRLKLLSHI